MVTVRTINTPQTREAATPNVDIGTRARAEDFGAGLGRGIASAGQSLGQIAAQKADERSRQSFANANERLLELDEHAAETLRNPETGFLVSNGEDTLGRYKKTRDSFDEKSRELAGTIKDPEARRQFELKSRRRKLTYDGSVNTKTSAEREKLFNNSHEALQRNELLRQADNYQNPVAVDVGLHNRIQSELEYMEHAGVNPEGEEGRLRIRAIISESYSVVIETALNNGDPRLAAKYLDRSSITDALGVNKTRDFNDRLRTGSILLDAQELVTVGLADSRASDLGSINDLQLEGSNKIREKLSDDAQKIALQQWHAGFETRKRLLRGQKNAFEETTIADAMSKEIPAKAFEIATRAADRDPVFAAKLTKMLRRKIYGDVPNDALSRSAFISAKLKAERGDYDNMTDKILFLELIDSGLTFSMHDEIKKYLEAPEKEPATPSQLNSRFKKMSGGEDMSYEFERAIMEELRSITGGDRKATSKEIDSAVGVFAIKGFGEGTGGLGTDDDNETQFELGLKGTRDSFQAILTDADRFRITRQTERAYANDPANAPVIDEEFLQRMHTSQTTSGNITVEQLEIARIMIDVSTDGNENLKAQDKAVQTAIIQLGEDGKGNVTQELTWQQEVDLVIYQSNNENEARRFERISSYPENLTDAAVKKLSNGAVSWSEVEKMMSIKARSDENYGLQLERLRAQKPSFAKGIEAGIKFILGGRAVFDITVPKAGIKQAPADELLFGIKPETKPDSIYKRIFEFRFNGRQ